MTPAANITGIDAALRAPGGWLPLAFVGILGLAMLAYVILDGYDLGVGILLLFPKLATWLPSVN